MEDLLDSFKKVTTHCEDEEYDTLIGIANTCKNALETKNDLRRVAELVYRTNRRYEDGMNLDPEFYRKLDFVTEDYVEYIIQLRYRMNEYWEVLRLDPANYLKQIEISNRIYLELLDGVQGCYNYHVFHKNSRVP